MMTRAPNRSKRRVAAGSSGRVNDPFGLIGLDIYKMPLPITEIPTWFQEMRERLAQRWQVVEESHMNRSLAGKLKVMLGREMKKHEVESWYDDAKCDVRWRIRLLDDRTEEGKLYRAYVGIACENDFFYPDTNRIKPMKEIIYFLLDLDQEAHVNPFSPPFLRTHQVLPDKWVKSKRDDRVVAMPMEGLVIPRRYSRARAKRAVGWLCRARSGDYWIEALDHLRGHIDAAMGPYERINQLGLLEKAIRKPSATLVRAIRDPMLKVGEFGTATNPRLTDRQIQMVVRRYRTLYPSVKRYLRLSVWRRVKEKFPQELVDRIGEAQERETQPKRVTLEIIAQELSLPVGVDALRRIIGPHLTGSR